MSVFEAYVSASFSALTIDSSAELAEIKTTRSSYNLLGLVTVLFFSTR